MICRRPRIRWASLALLAGGLGTFGSPASAHENLFFLHHSTGHNLIDQGDVRPYIDGYNATQGTHLAFWDHDYNWEGLRDPAGSYVGHSYEIPGDNTDPDGLHYLWTVPNAARDSILANHEVIAFKSCYPASHVDSDAKLAQYQAWYLSMRDFFDAQPERIFVVMSPPPLHRLDTNLSEADRARAFAVWLGSPAYLSGHPNIAYFDLFNHLARAADGSATRNVLRYEYELDHASGDSHPNLLANQTVGPVFAEFLIQTAGGAASVDETAPWTSGRGMLCRPNPVREAATILYRAARPGWTRLTIYDAAGRLVQTLADRHDEAGTHEARWVPRSREESVRSGAYWARLEREEGIVENLRLIVLR